MAIRILLVDDQKLMRIGIKSLFEEYPELEIVAEAQNGAEAVEKAKLLKPDIVLMDIGLPDISGIDATKKIMELNIPNVKVVILTAHVSEDEIFNSLSAGAFGYIMKDINTEQLMVILKTIKK